MLSWRQAQLEHQEKPPTQIFSGRNSPSNKTNRKWPSNKKSNSPDNKKFTSPENKTSPKEVIAPLANARIFYDANPWNVRFAAVVQRKPKKRINKT